MANSIALRVKAKPLALAVASAFFSADVAAQTTPGALPAGGQVASGSATLTYSPNKLQIDQGTNKAILQWDSFSIGSSAWVNFSQPSPSSVALNRVTGNNPSEIFGRLTANGQVFLTNSNGVLFARSASVDVGGLFASTLSIADRDFLEGRYNFYNAGGAGSVVNQGVITATGYAALAGTQVHNDGVIIARAGTVALAAADRVSLDMVGDGLIKVSVDQAALNASAINSGRIEADGGNVILTARSANALLDTVVNNSGVIRANSLVERHGEIVLDGGSAGVVSNSGTLQAAGANTGTVGGMIRIFGDRVALAGNAVLDASGDVGGGAIQVGSPSSNTTFIGAGATMRADAVREGRGGIVETSGHHLEVNAAPQVGAGGTWLIDPFDIEIVPGSGTSNNAGPANFTANADNSQIGATLIENQLNAGGNVLIYTGSAGSPGTQAGDILVNAAIEKTAGNPASLYLNAFHDVQVNQPIRIASSAPGPFGYGTLSINAGNNVVVAAPITTSGGGLTVVAGSFTNLSTISNGVGGSLQPGMSISADGFNLANGAINGGLGSVGLFTRTAGKSLGVESPGDVRISNADIASITTSPDSPLTNANQLLMGVAFPAPGILGGSITIGQDARVDGGTKNLWFSSSFAPGSSVSVGANGVSTSGDVSINTGGTMTGSGTVAGNHVVLQAGTGIGGPGARLNTAATMLAARTNVGSVYIAEADDVSLGPVTFAGGTNFNGVGRDGVWDVTAGGNVNVNGILGLGGRMNLAAGGRLTLDGAGVQDSGLFANGGQTVSAAALALIARNGRRASIGNTGGAQSVTVGAGGIALDASGKGTVQIFNNAGSSAQDISTDGALTVLARGATSGLFQNQAGKQTVTAGSISLQGGLADSNGLALINNVTGNGDQEINVAGSLRAAGGAEGLANRAAIITNGNQLINAGDITMIGGISGSGSALAGTHNNAAMTINNPLRTQTINAGSITMTAGSGNDAFVGITAGNQVINVGGDVLLTGGSGTGISVARIGGSGSPVTPTNLTLNAANVTLVGGGAPGGEALLGGTALGTVQADNNITVTATRDVILRAESAGRATIGTSTSFVTPAAGNISITGGTSIQLNGTAQPTAIRTLGDVSLSAGGTISEGPKGYVLADALTTRSGGAMTLVGPNQLNWFTASSIGDLALTNAAPLLSLPAVNTHGGSFVLRQAGDASFVGNSSVGALDVNATGSLYVLGGQAATELAAGGLINVVSGGDLRIAGGSASGAFAALKGYSDVRLTVGGELRINPGTGDGAYASLQTASRDSIINIYFPNLASGGWYVNDIEGALRRGRTGILSGEGVAVANHMLFVTYGQ